MLIIWTHTVQDYLLARVIFGEFYIGDFVPRAIEHAQIETKMAGFILAISA